jgi:hypothetical protein
MLKFKFIHINFSHRRLLGLFLYRVVQYFIEICGVSINLNNLRICDLRTGMPKKFADIGKRNEPKDLRIFDFRTLKKVCLSTSAF